MTPKKPAFFLRHHKPCGFRATSNFVCISEGRKLTIFKIAISSTAKVLIDLFGLLRGCRGILMIRACPLLYDQGSRLTRFGSAEKK